MKWKSKTESKLYDYKHVKSVIYQLNSLLKRKNIYFFKKEEKQLYALLDLVRNIMCRDFAGINNPRLYSTSLTGTKIQIEELKIVISKSLEFIKDHPTFENKLVDQNFQIINRPFSDNYLTILEKPPFAYLEGLFLVFLIWVCFQFS